MTAQILKPFRMSPPVGDPPQQVIAGLKDLLEKAERGEIRGMAAVISGPDGSMQSAIFDGETSCIALLGGIRLMERDFIAKFWG